jgi:hypothetical protein
VNPALASGKAGSGRNIMQIIIAFYVILGFISRVLDMKAVKARRPFCDK